MKKEFRAPRGAEISLSSFQKELRGFPLLISIAIFLSVLFKNMYVCMYVCNYVNIIKTTYTHIRPMLPLKQQEHL